MNHDHKKYSGPHGKCEGVKRGMYNCELREHNQFGQNMSRERNEHSMESGMESIRKMIHLYIGTTVPNSQKKKKRDSGTSTTCAKRGSGHSVPVLHLLVPVPPGGFGAN